MMNVLSTIYNSPEGKTITYLRGLKWQTFLELSIELLKVSSIHWDGESGVIFLKTPVCVVSYEPLLGALVFLDLDLDNPSRVNSFPLDEGLKIIKDLCFYINLFEKGKVERYGWKVILPPHRG